MMRLSSSLQPADFNVEGRSVRPASIILAISVVMLTAMPVPAHHALAAEFDANQAVVLHGTITKVARVNPHGWIYIDVKGPDGKVVNWTIETGAPVALARRGVTKDTFSIGAEVTVRAFRAKDGSLRAAGDTVRFSDGRVVSIAGSAGDGARGSVSK
jgi:Family of unknown function (DUF6152)